MFTPSLPKLRRGAAVYFLPVVADVQVAPAPENSGDGGLLVALLALMTFLRGYLFLGAPAEAEPLPRRFPLLSGVAVGPFLSEGYVSTLLCRVLPGFLAKGAGQRRRHKPAAGGWRHPNVFAQRDVQQAPANLDELRRESSARLCERLGEELRLLIRLIRATQRYYWKPEKEWPGRGAWMREWYARHHAVVLVLLRIVHICARLRKRGTPWFAVECLRWQLRLVWEDIFGPNVPQTSAVCKWMQPQQLPDEIEQIITIRLLWERERGLPPPSFFVEMVAFWESKIDGNVLATNLERREAREWV